MDMFNVFAGLFHLAADELLTTAGGPSLRNKSNYENKPTQLPYKRWAVESDAIY